MFSFENVCVHLLAQASNIKFRFVMLLLLNIHTNMFSFLGSLILQINKAWNKRYLRQLKALEFFRLDYSGMIGYMRAIWRF